MFFKHANKDKVAKAFSYLNTAPNKFFTLL